MNLFNLLDDLELMALTPSDNTDVITNKLDFTKKEDLDKLVDAVDEIKNSDNTLVKGLVSLFGNTLDAVVDSAKKTYNEAHPVNNNTRKVVDKSAVAEPVRPSSKIAEEAQKTIAKLVTEYVNTKIIPNTTLTSEQIKSIGDGLFEFACWIYTR